MKSFQSIRSCNSWLLPLHRLEGWLAGLSLGLSLGVVTLASSTPAQAKPTAPQTIPTAAPTVVAPSVKAEPTAILTDGVYLYGQSQEPNQIGQGYFVFEVRQGKVLGALYMPQSSFDCAYGSFQAEQLALTVVDSYERTPHPFEIALDRTVPVATTGNPALPQPGLQGFHRIDQVSDNDRRILNVCKQNYQKQVWN